MEKKQTETFRGKIIAIRIWTYTREGEAQTAGELVVAAPSGEKRHVALFGDACSHCDGFWLDETTWSYVKGPKLKVNQYVQVVGYPSEKEWASDKFGLVVQKKIAVYDPKAVTKFKPAKRPTDGAAPETPKTKPRPKRPI